MGRLIKYLLILVLVALVIIIGYSVFGDLSAPQTEVSKKVLIDVN